MNTAQKMAMQLGKPYRLTTEEGISIPRLAESYGGHRHIDRSGGEDVFYFDDGSALCLDRCGWHIEG